MPGEGDLAERLVERAAERLRWRAERFRRALEEAPKAAEALAAEGLVHTLSAVDEGAPAAGLDGSRQVVAIGLGSYLVLAATALVVLPEGLRSSEPLLENPEAEAVIIHDPAGALVEQAAELGMLYLETRTMLSVPRSVAVAMLDGPVADPPLEPPAGVVELLRSSGLPVPGAYHEARASTISSLLDDGVRVVGVVKRIGGLSLLSSRLPEELSSLRSLGDEDVLAVLADHLPEGHVYIGPLGAPVPARVAEAYRIEDVEILSCYTFSPGDARAYRVEVAARPWEDPLRVLEKALGAVHGLTVPGQPYPLPVALAHEKSHIPRSLASLVYREAIARMAAEERLAPIVRRIIDEGQA